MGLTQSIRVRVRVMVRVVAAQWVWMHRRCVREASVHGPLRKKQTERKKVHEPTPSYHRDKTPHHDNGNSNPNLYRSLVRETHPIDPEADLAVECRVKGQPHHQAV